MFYSQVGHWNYQFNVKLVSQFLVLNWLKIIQFNDGNSFTKVNNKIPLMYFCMHLENQL